MPVDITNVTVLFENGLKREEYGPTRKASVSMTAAVDKGEDGVVAMNYIATLARGKVAEMLGLALPAEAAAAIEAPPAGEPVKPARQRRAPAANAPAGTSAVTATDVSADAEPDGSSAASELPPTSSDSQVSTDDDWSTGEDEKPADTTPITDADMAMHCSKAAQRLGGGEKVKDVITSYKPNGWDKPKFGVTDILASQRPGFVAKLEALT